MRIRDVSPIRILSPDEARHPDVWMPPIEVYIAFAEHLHNQSELCNENYDVRFEACDLREQDISDAINILRALYRDGWALSRTALDNLALGL